MQMLFHSAFMSCRFLLMFASMAIFGCTRDIRLTYVYPELCTRNIVSVGERVVELKTGFMHSSRLYLYQGMENSNFIKLSLDFVQNRRSYHLNTGFYTDDLNKGNGLMVEDINFRDTNGDIYFFYYVFS